MGLMKSWHLGGNITSAYGRKLLMKEEEVKIGENNRTQEGDSQG